MTAFLDVLEPHPTWSIIDSSKLKTFCECPRKYFFSYILGWRPQTPNNHLVFGSAWHLALEHLWLNGMGSASILDATEKFVEYYRSVFPDATDELFEPKTPLAAANAIADYALKYAPLFRESRVHYTELGGVMLISDTRTMIFKCDVILEDERGNIGAIDFKTSQRRLQNWGETWVLSMQMLAYLHALHCLYPDQEDITMTVQTAFFYKNDRRGHATPTVFEDYPIRKTLDQMNAWLWRVNAWVDALDYNMDVLTHEDDTEAPAMSSFPQNDTACFNYGRPCPYFDYCNSWPNPLARIEDVPLGLNVEWWDPLAQPELRQTIDLTGGETA